MDGPFLANGNAGCGALVIFHSRTPHVGTMEPHTYSFADHADSYGASLSSHPAAQGATACRTHEIGFLQRLAAGHFLHFPAGAHHARSRFRALWREKCLCSHPFVGMDIDWRRTGGGRTAPACSVEQEETVGEKSWSRSTRFHQTYIELNSLSHGNSNSPNG